MRLDDAKIILGNKIYRTSGVTWEQCSSCEYPRIEVDAYIGPYYCIGDYNSSNSLTIKDIIFNPPATIVFWSDGTKTVVKADGEAYDPEKGIAMAISKKLMGDNKYEYYHTFLHWLKKWNKQQENIEKETTNA